MRAEQQPNHPVVNAGTFHNAAYAVVSADPDTSEKIDRAVAAFLTAQAHVASCGQPPPDDVLDLAETIVRLLPAEEDVWV